MGYILTHVIQRDGLPTYFTDAGQSTIPSIDRRNLSAAAFMNYTEIDALARTAASKIRREASQKNRCLRYLIGHSLLLQALRKERADVERNQQLWFANIVREATNEVDP